MHFSIPLSELVFLFRYMSKNGWDRLGHEVNAGHKVKAGHNVNAG